ncbi:MAG TPA: cysteine desulfurase family protein [Bacilli bacterium]|nr:cysteine desulfurase family protein [Bacilli bacterium]
MDMIYLDNAATTRIAPEVRAAMEPYLTEVYGNPSSTHRAGREARGAVDKARDQVAKALGAKASEIVFTSGGTEADNAALVGVALAHRERGKHIVTTAMEHHAVLHTCAFLESLGFEVTYVQPDRTGRVSVESVRAALRDETILLSVMMVNNETGAVQPIADLAEMAQEHGVIFHTDAVQAVGQLPLDVNALGVDLLSVSGHKVHGPKGVGALYVRQQVKWTPYQYGGAQEQQRRAGTENLASLVGFGMAMERAVQGLEDKVAQVQKVRQAMLDVFTSELGTDGYIVNSPEDGVPAILNVTFPGASSERLLMNLDMQGVMASSGSACTSGSLQPSHVLLAMCLTEEAVRSAIRFSFSGYNTVDEVQEAARKVCASVERLRRR